MPSLTLPASLVSLVPATAGGGHSQRLTVDFDARSMSELLGGIRDRFPGLADRLITGSGEVSPAFVVVINGEITRRPPGSLPLAADDEVHVLAAMAGG